MAVPVVLAAAAVAASAASAYVSYKGSSDAAKLGEQQSAIQRQQNLLQAQTASVNARQQEEERQRQADVSRASGIAGAASAGFDYWLSPTASTIDAENNRLAQGDVSSLQLLGAAGQYKSQLEGRAIDLQSSAYSAQASNAWVAPTISLIGSAAQAGAMYQTGKFGTTGKAA